MHFARAFFIGIPLLLTVILLITGIRPKEADGSEMAVPIWSLPLFGLLFVEGVLPLLQMMSVRSVRRQNRTAEGQQYYTFSEDGLSIRGSTFETNLKWDAFAKVSESKEFLFFYISSHMAHFLSKSALTAAELEGLRTLLHEKLGSNARLQS